MTRLLATIGGLGSLLVLSGFFSGSETALCALTRAQVERLRGDSGKGSRSIVRFVDDPRRLFITILLGNTFVNIAFATLSASLMYRVFGAGPTGRAIAVATVVITLALLVFGEITPKTFAIRHAERFASFTAPILWTFSVLIFPVRRLLRLVTNLLLVLFGGVPATTDERVTREHLDAVLEAGDRGTPGAEELEIIGRILDLHEIRASEVMVPRTDIVAMRSSATVGEALQRSADVGFSRLPIFREDLDDVSGVFQVKDWLAWQDEPVAELTVDEFLAARTALSARDRPPLVHPPFFTPETRRVADLFAELTQHRSKAAFLVDEYGGVSGWVTVEDIVEEVIGEIVDEHDAPVLASDLSIRPGDPSVCDVSGRLSVRTVNHKLGLHIDESLADTVGGYVVARLGHVPAAGESFRDDDGVGFEVARTERQRVIVVTIRMSPAES